MNNEQLDFEQPDVPSVNCQTPNSLEMLLHRMTNRIRQSLELSVILAGVTDEVRAFLGTDRVKVYQFEPSSSGEVVAESLEEKKLPSLLGQHFPAEDIPLEIRQLYRTKRERTIVNVASRQIGMSSLPEDDDRDHIQFRTVDPCHAEYLTAMGVQSSLVVPIMDEDHLWGLLVSHHSSPRIVTPRELEVVQLVADQTSIAIAQSNLLESTRLQAQQEASINRVGKFLHSMTQMQLQQALKQTVLALKGSGGRVYLAPSNSESMAQLYISGEQPVLLPGEVKQKLSLTMPMEKHPDWQAWLQKTMQTDHVIQPWAIAKLDANLLPSSLDRAFRPTKIKSILTIQLEYRQKQLGYLSIFRQGIDLETIWAKRPDFNDPRNQVALQSFEIWREIKLNQAFPWTEREIELAQILGSHFAIAIYQYQLYQQVNALNTSLEQRVQERTAELERTNQELVQVISDRLKTRADLERVSHQNELILNSAGEGIYGLDLKGRITFINPAAAQILGYDVKELQNQPMQEIVNHSTAEGIVYPWSKNPIYQTIQTGKVHHVTNEIFTHKDKSSFPVEYVSTPILEKEQIVGAVVIFKDITERQIIDRMKDEFVSVVSHELRTPLTSIRSSISLLSSGRIDPQSPKSQRLIEIAQDNSNRLVRLINDILDLERIKSGKVTMLKSSCNAADVMNDAVEIVQSIADKAGIKIAVEPLSVELWIDRDRIIQTLTNLLSNAIKFSSPQTTVTLDARLQNDDTVRFQVQDCGRGIPPEHLETVFDRFQQVDASDSRDRGGTGLGLAICRSIVQQHGGQIWVESSLGKGSRFCFVLPIRDQ
ncbi:histidine kinase [Pleurocapsa sp. CCALA 161]|uniref:ATP-binding protein n=1 Tax=Pleurocapsa sp. CCALA 161 TaxID=2107688 RepID=UPI000D04C70A|nr:ATP-binding protein [Pleurocapsa sp. CCALA 161]PSB06885.1 histidine kinase [Pleurocapsa sp. CCALA 161]